MSTSYYRLRPPITNLELDEGLYYDVLKVWINDSLAGELALTEDEVKEVIRCFALREADNECPLRAYWGGDEEGTVVYANEDNLPDEMIVVSTYGEILTVGQVKARAGRQDMEN